MRTTDARKRLLIVGGGFAGLWAALSAARENHRTGELLEIEMISRDPYLTLRPRLYQQRPETLRTPLRSSLEPVGVTLREGTVAAVDTAARAVSVVRADGASEDLRYDGLVLATGSALAPLPVPGGERHAWNLDTYESAVSLDAHLEYCLRHPDQPGNTTVVIVGAGLSGVEFATELRRRAAAEALRIVLIEKATAVVPGFGAAARAAVADALRAARVDVRTATTVAEITEEAIRLDGGETIATATVVNTIGPKASALAERLAGAQRDALGRLVVDNMLRVVGLSNVYAAGDIACASVDGDHVSAMSCQHAIPMGRSAGHNAACGLLGRSPTAYAQPSYVTCIDLGDSGAAFTRGWGYELEKTGAEAKRFKHMINTQVIYPPQGMRDAILEAATPEALRA